LPAEFASIPAEPSLLATPSSSAAARAASTRSDGRLKIFQTMSYIINVPGEKKYQINDHQAQDVKQGGDLQMNGKRLPLLSHH